MHAELRNFLGRLTGVVGVPHPVIVTAFLSVPLSLGRHPGRPRRLTRHNCVT